MEQCSISSVSICPNGSITINAPYMGATYQWQVDNGSGYTSISNGGYYSGATTSQLQLTNMPSSFYGAKFRCLVNSNITSSTILKFSVTWTGNQGTGWENASNWGCNALPNADTDVIIPIGTGIVELNSTSTVRSFKTEPGANFKVNTGARLTILY
jgi:hypothetical protein